MLDARIIQNDALRRIILKFWYDPKHHFKYRVSQTNEIHWKGSDDQNCMAILCDELYANVMRYLTD
jgi:hypothetical protein